MLLCSIYIWNTVLILWILDCLDHLSSLEIKEKHCNNPEFERGHSQIPRDTSNLQRWVMAFKESVIYMVY